MNKLFNFATSKEALDLFNAARSTYNNITSRAPPQKDKFPKKLDEKLVKKVLTKHSEQWYTAEMKDGGFALIFESENWIVYYSSQSSDLDIMKLLYTDFNEILGMKNRIDVINKIVESILANPNYDPIYHAVIAGLTEYVTQQIMVTNKAILQKSLNENQETIAHVVALHGRADLVKFMILNGLDIRVRSKKGQNIAHYGAQNADVLKVIAENVAKNNFNELLITEDSAKHTVIHLALKNERATIFLIAQCPDVFKLQFKVPLINVIPDLNIEDEALITGICEILHNFDPDFLDKKDYSGNNIFSKNLPIKTQRILLNYASENCINSLDSSGKSALHRAAGTNDLEVIIALLSFGADVNMKDSRGKTPIFYAVSNKHLSAVKGLLLFNAVVDEELSSITSTEFKKVLHFGSTKYYEREPRTQFKLNPDSVEDIALQKSVDYLRSPGIDASQFFDAISFDGGGMRGLVSLQILREINNRYDGDFLKTFKTLGGTSTGSIIILAIAKYGDLEKVFRLYLRLKDHIFCGSRPYDGEKLENLLIKELGGTCTLENLGKSKGMRLAIATARVDISPPKLEMFRSYTIPENIKDSRFSTTLEKWSAARVARCSSAAPSYFPSVEGKYMDGGIVANNPSCEILCDQQTISLLLPESKQRMRLMLSIGTGKTPMKKASNVDVSIPENSISGWVSSINSIVHMKNVFLDQLTSADGVNVDRARMMSSAMNTVFLRFSPQLSQEYELDETRADRLIDMMWETKMYMNTKLNEINFMFDLLK